MTTQRHAAKPPDDPVPEDVLYDALRNNLSPPSAIGHLFEAENESQEWPELHAAIRAARKAYQANGEAPRWDWLGQLIDGAQPLSA